MHDRDVVAELISPPSEALRLRANLKFGLQNLLIVVVARTQHHPMLAEGDWFLITIGRDVFYRENRHCQESNANARHMHYRDQMLHAANPYRYFVAGFLDPLPNHNSLSMHEKA